MHRPFTTIAVPLLAAALLGATTAEADTASGRDGAPRGVLTPPPPPPVEDHKPGGGGLWVNNGPDAGFVTLVPAE